MEAGMSGLPFWGSDVGGFTPVFRAHGTGPREPWTGTSEDCSIISSVIRTRYRLLPYIYSTAHEASLGVPMMRPMIYESAKAPASCLNTQYMFGSEILVAPVTEPAAGLYQFPLSDRRFRYLSKPPLSSRLI